jgi:hypothetical protein
MNRRAVGSFFVGLSLACAPGVARSDDAPKAPASAPAQDAAAAVPDRPSPHIKFDATEINLGDVVHGQDAVATFTYRNTGSAPLHILSAKPG